MLEFGVTGWIEWEGRPCKCECAGNTQEAETRLVCFHLTCDSAGFETLDVFKEVSFQSAQT